MGSETTRGIVLRSVCCSLLLSCAQAVQPGANAAPLALDVAATTPEDTPVAIDVLGLDGTTKIKTLFRASSTGQTEAVHAATAGFLILHARGTSVNATGAFSVSIGDLGADEPGTDDRQPSARAERPAK